MNELNQNNEHFSFKSAIEDVVGFSAETLKVVVVSLIVIIFIRSYVMQPFFVSGSSMEPNFQNGDYIIVDEISYKLDDPKRGDVIIFRFPKDPNEFYIKRIIGLPGEKIEIENNKITIYNAENPGGFLLNENFYIPQDNIITGNYTAELKNDEYYVLGDNRVASSDSRFWGLLERHFIVGKAFIRTWPFDSVSVFEDMQYDSQ